MIDELHYIKCLVLGFIPVPSSCTLKYCRYSEQALNVDPIYPKIFGSSDPHFHNHKSIYFYFLFLTPEHCITCYWTLALCITISHTQFLPHTTICPLEAGSNLWSCTQTHCFYKIPVADFSIGRSNDQVWLSDDWSCTSRGVQFCMFALGTGWLFSPALLTFDNTNHWVLILASFLFLGFSPLANCYLVCTFVQGVTNVTPLWGLPLGHEVWTWSLRLPSLAKILSSFFTKIKLFLFAQGCILFSL